LETAAQLNHEIAAAAIFAKLGSYNTRSINVETLQLGSILKMVCRKASLVPATASGDLLEIVLANAITPTSRLFLSE